MLSVKLAFFALLIGTSFATPVETSAVSDPLVLTVHGWCPSTNVHAIPTGGSVRVVGDEVQLLSGNGAVVQSANVTNDQATTGTTPLISDSIAYAAWHNKADSLYSFNTSLTVPSDPNSYTGQTLFYSHAMFSSTLHSTKHTLAAVLQYGPSEAGGGEGWSTALWYRIGSNIYYTSANDTIAGTTLRSFIHLNSVANELFSYTASFRGAEGLTIETDIEFIGVVNGLIVNSIQKASNFPADDTVFHHIDVGVVADTDPSVTWEAVSDVADGVVTVVNDQGAQNAKVTMSYLA